MRQIVLAQRDLDLHAGIGVVAEHLDDAPDGLHVLRRLHDDLDRHDLARPARPRLSSGGIRKSRLMRLFSGTTNEHAVLAAQPPDDAPLRALEHFHDLAFGPAAAIDTRRCAPSRGRRAAPSAFR